MKYSTGLNGFVHSKTAQVVNMAIKGITVTALSMPLMLSANAEEAGKKVERNVEVIEVKGIRSSILKAQHLKRDANSVIDAISADDLGKFSDASISDAIQRIPGVQIERNDGGQEGDRVSIRGLGPTYVTTTVNGRTAMSSGTEGLSNLRSFNLEVIPTDIISTIIVKKTPTASDPESGLAGSVELITRQALDASLYRDDKNYFGSITLQADKGSIGDEVGNRASFLFGAKTEDDSMGFYVSYLDSESKPGRDQLFPTVIQQDIQIDNTGDGLADETVEGVHIINAIDFEPIRETQLRESFAAGVQWQVNDKLTITADTVFTSFDNASIRNRIAPVFGPAIAGSIFAPEDIVITDANGHKTLQSVAQGGFSEGQVVPIQFIPFLFGNKTESSVSGINFDYQLTDNLHMNLDFHYSDVDYMQDLDLPILVQDIDAQQVSFNTDNGLFHADLGEIDNAAYQYPKWASLIRDVFMEGEQYGARVDFEYMLDNGFVESIEFGARYTKEEVDSVRTNILDVSGDLTEAELYDIGQTGLGDTNIDYNYYPGTGVFNDFPDGDFQHFCDEVVQLCKQGNELGVDPASSFAYQEEVLALYGEANMSGEIFGLDSTSNVGVRAVNVKFSGQGLRVNPDKSTTPTSTSNDYWEFLPSANLGLDLDDDLTLRLAAARVMSRPNPSDLVPREAANPIYNVGDIPSGQRGNAELEPTISYIFDATLEYYNDMEGAYIASVFYKDVNDFVFPITTKETLPGQGDTIYDVRTPQNFSDGTVMGVELGFNQPFLFLDGAWSGFGVQANYTYSDSEFEKDVGDNGYGFPGSSKHNFNSILYFEQGDFGVRLSYIYRDDYFRNLPGQGAQAENSSAVFTESDQRLNFNASYDINEHFSVFFDVNNITEEGRRDFYYQKETFNGSFNRERTLTVGITGRL
ncbi:TonB-dependent receptor [Colwellia demingiae]|uniref:TonB-dependent receptor n=1 Tax=Colwellia demingiae TaxID=89401 RepID=A0A5C6QDR4_9GAMM|nr:TonB-dependent receptor [Colwellia demingiae]TWX66860.1 TonB-dependent receptor [Colwellia demingiae]